ncbi:MAG: DUF502 domain-containing protein [Alphaproteobacteria bacterium]
MTKTPKQRRSLLGYLRDLLLTGALFALPIGLTFWIVNLLFNIADNTALNFLFPTSPNPQQLPYVFPGLGLALGLALITLLGVLSAGVLGRFFLNSAERLLLARLPVVRSLYKTSKQIAQTIFSEHSKAFREAALLRYPHESSWSIAFVSAPPPAEIQRLIGKDITTLFLPAVPNPTTGFLLFAEPGQWKPLNMDLDEALKFVVSGGILQREQQSEETPKSPPTHRRVRSWVQRHFFGGLLIGLPVFFTLWLCWQIAVFLDNLLRPLVPGTLVPSNPWIALPGVGILMTLVLLLVLGLLVRGWIGRIILPRVERLVARVPFVGGIYSAFKLILDSAFSRSAMAFRESVLFEYPHSGVWGVGFLTSDENSALRESMDGEEMVNLFFPTTPNPTTGFFLIVPRSRVRRLEMSLEDTFKLILSIGTSTSNGVARGSEELAHEVARVVSGGDGDED